MTNLISQIAFKNVGTSTAMKTMPFILFALAMLSLASCTPLGMATGATVGGIYSTRPGEGPPPDLADQVPQHESWCYETAGYAECYAYPVKDANSRLIMVDPANRYPLTARAYHETVIESQQP